MYVMIMLLPVQVTAQDPEPEGEPEGEPEPEDEPEPEGEPDDETDDAGMEDDDPVEGFEEQDMEGEAEHEQGI